MSLIHWLLRRHRIGARASAFSSSFAATTAREPAYHPRGVHVRVDAISALGTMPIDLSNVYLATGVSTKGIGSAPGVSIVFHDHDVAPATDLPRYLDLGLYAGGALPFTQSSNLLEALDASLRRLEDRQAVWHATAEDCSLAAAAAAARGLHADRAGGAFRSERVHDRRRLD